MSFISGGKTFILITLHVIYGKAPADRVTELKAIAEWLSGWAKDINGWDHNLIALGDFNIDRQGDKLYEAFTSTGLQVATWHEGLPRTIFGDNKKKSSFFDQIAWFNKDSGVPALSMEAVKGGNFDFVQHVYEGMEKQDLSWRLSDHYPLWVEFGIGD